jgi:hypothetical protein
MTRDENRYFGIKDGEDGYDGLIIQEFKNGGLTLGYMSQTGWIEDNRLNTDLRDADTTAIDAATASYITQTRFHQPLER